MSSTINPAGWVKNATASSATATATQSAPAAATGPKKNVVFGVDASFAPVSTVAATLTINDGATPIWVAQIPIGTATFVRSFHRGLGITPGNACSAVLTSGGAVGNVNLDGVVF